MVKPRYSQTWSSILGYIKRELGTGVNLLEMSDDEIVEGLDEDVLSLMSQFTPHKDYTYITSANKLSHTIPGQAQWRYLLPVSDDVHIIDIYEVMPDTDVLNLNELGRETSDYSADNMINLVISNAYVDAARSLGVRNTWNFVPPRTIEMDKELRRGCIIYNTPHVTPKTMRPDLYNTTFKPLCLGTVQKWIAAKRAKFENVSTPFGQLNLNWSKLETDSQTNIQEAMQKLELVPPDRLIEIC